MILSIGYGKINIENFISLLKQYDIAFLIDIRSVPYSKGNQDFNQEVLKFHLDRVGIKYVFMGDSIGGRPKDLSCYHPDGKVNYEALEATKDYQTGLERLVTASKLESNVVMMCSEANPLECHRTKLIGRSLKKREIEVYHITHNGDLKTQITLDLELNKGLPTTDLWGDEIFMKSRKKYV